MGQKVNPIGLRLGVNKTWKSKWYVDPKNYADTLHEDLRIRKALESCPETKGADISDVEIIRKPRGSLSSSRLQDRDHHRVQRVQCRVARKETAGTC